MSEAEVPTSPTHLLWLDETCCRVEDADTEVFELYSMLSSSDGSSTTERVGLGYIDATRDVVTFDLELKPPTLINSSQDDPALWKAKSSRRNKSKRTNSVKSQDGITLSVDMHQDIHALRTRKGDTGSVVWRASLFLAEHLLTQHRFTSPTLSPSLINYELAKSSNVLELGSGTGILPVFIAHLFNSWTATDQYDNLKLLRRNVSEGSLEKSTAKISVQELDWMHSLDPRDRRDGQAQVYDLVMAVDCIYNEALVKPLVATFNKVTTPERTLVWVVLELRSSDVVTAFLGEWTSQPGWSIWRLGQDAMGPKLSRGYVGWVGWRIQGS